MPSIAWQLCKENLGVEILMSIKATARVTFDECSMFCVISETKSAEEIEIPLSFLLLHDILL